jgi:tetratricopeptide (TPR) repeat protein
MIFHQLRISIIPILLLSTGIGIVTWIALTGIERERSSRVVSIVEAHQAGHLDEDAARSQLLQCASERDLLRWRRYPTGQVRDSAVYGLGLIGTSRSVPALLDLLSAPQRRVRLLAEQALREARQRSGNAEVDALLLRAQQLQASGRGKDALELLDRATRMLDGHAETYFLMGTICLERREYRVAAAAFTEAIERDPDHFDAYLGRGICRLKRGGLRRARTDCLKAFEINPNMEEARLLAESLSP